MTPDLTLYAILDPARTRGRSLPALADAAVRGGATLLQLRIKDAGTRDFLAAAAQVHAAIAGRIPLLINDRVDIAQAIGAEGVHIGRDDMPPAIARRLLGRDAIIGITLKTADDVAAIDPRDVSYGCIGGVFATASKQNADPPVGLAGFSALRAQCPPGLPVGAIAGIDHSNAADVIAAGADGVAVISALFMADDVEAATRRMRSILDQARQQRKSNEAPA